MSGTPTLDVMSARVRETQRLRPLGAHFVFHVSASVWLDVCRETSPGAFREEPLAWRGTIYSCWERLTNRHADLRINGDVVARFVIPTVERA